MHAEIQEVGGTVQTVLQFAEQEVDFNAFNTIASVTGALSGISSFSNVMIGSAIAWLLF